VKFNGELKVYLFPPGEVNAPLMNFVHYQRLARPEDSRH
jgi:hypothetical protein